MRTLEPQQLYTSRVVKQSGYQPAFAAFTFFHDIDQRPRQLYIFCSRTYSAYLRDLCTVKIPVRIVIQQVFKRSDLQFLTQQLAPLRAYAFQEFYGSVLYGAAVADGVIFSNRKNSCKYLFRVVLYAVFFLVRAVLRLYSGSGVGTIHLRLAVQAASRFLVFDKYLAGTARRGTHGKQVMPGS